MLVKILVKRHRNSEKLYCYFKKKFLQSMKLYIISKRNKKFNDKRMFSFNSKSINKNLKQQKLDNYID